MEELDGISIFPAENLQHPTSTKEINDISESKRMPELSSESKSVNAGNPVTSDISEIKFTKAWESLMPLYLPKCIYESNKNGPGINYFSMITVNKSGDSEKSFNCEFNYIVKNSYHWDLFIIGHDDFDTLMEDYDEQKYTLLAIYIPSIKKMEIKKYDI